MENALRDVLEDAAAWTLALRAAAPLVAIALLEIAALVEIAGTAEIAALLATARTVKTAGTVVIALEIALRAAAARTAALVATALAVRAAILPPLLNQSMFPLLNHWQRRSSSTREPLEDLLKTLKKLLEDLLQ